MINRGKCYMLFHSLTLARNSLGYADQRPATKDSDRSKRTRPATPDAGNWFSKPLGRPAGTIAEDDYTALYIFGFT